MNAKRNQLLLKLAFGIVSVSAVLAFSVVVTTSTYAQGQATPAPTTPAATPAPTTPAQTPAATPATSGQAQSSTQVQAPSTALLRTEVEMSHLTDEELSSKLEEAQNRVRNQSRQVNRISSRHDQDADQLTGLNNLTVVNEKNDNDEDLAGGETSVAATQRDLLAAEAVINAHAGFDANGAVVDRQAAINTIALIEMDLGRSATFIKRVNSDTDNSGQP